MEENNLSPALAAMVAQLTMPVAYARVVSQTVMSMNARCSLFVKKIEK